MTRKKAIDNGTLYITYQDNGWTRFFAEYEDGTTEEWFEKE